MLFSVGMAAAMPVGGSDASPQLSLCGGGVVGRPSLNTSTSSNTPSLVGIEHLQSAPEVASTSSFQLPQPIPKVFPACATGLVCPSRVSEKIQQLVNTLKRPKRRPLPEYFMDEDDQILVQPVVDPNAPKPLGASTEPLVGEKLMVCTLPPLVVESAVIGCPYCLRSCWLPL